MAKRQAALEEAKAELDKVKADKAGDPPAEGEEKPEDAEDDYPEFDADEFYFKFDEDNFPITIPDAVAEDIDNDFNLEIVEPPPE